MGRRPDFELVITNKKDNSRKNRNAGIGFYHANSGGISLILNPGVVLTHDLTETHWVALYPTEGSTPPAPPPAPPAPQPDQRTVDQMTTAEVAEAMTSGAGEDDIPF